MIEKVFFVTSREMRSEVEDYIGCRPISAFVGVPSAMVYDDYCEWCDSNGRMSLTKVQFGKAFSEVAGTVSVPRSVKGRSMRVIALRETEPVRRKRKTSPEAGVSYDTWVRLSYERVDEYIRSMCTFEGMDYEELHEEYSGWCSEQGYVPFPLNRFASVFGRKWQEIGGYTTVGRRRGHSRRIIHDPLPD